jgi:peptidoglycan/xylan/chitin deacetylase (PgdA/CDA1 family)
MLSRLQTLFDVVIGALKARRASTKLLILSYHRVLVHEDPFHPSEPTVDVFRWQMKMLARHFNVISLSHAVELSNVGRLPKRAVAITFDDGYRNNFECALPVLKEFNLPATIFVATAYLNDGCMWNDRVIEAIRNHGAESIDLEFLGLPHVQLKTTSERIDLIHKILFKLKHLEYSEREKMVTRLVDSVDGKVPTGLMMTESQVAALAKSDIVVGAHTVNHPILACISDDEAEKEIRESKSVLERITGLPVTLFAYPNGRPGQDYSPTHIRMLESAGFDAAVTTVNACADRSRNLFELPRISPYWKSPVKFYLNLLAAYAN